MPKYFFDTSALVKRYCPEVGTAVVDSLFATQGDTRIVSRLCVIETVSALAMKVRMGELTAEDYSLTRKKFLSEISGGTIAAARILAAHYRLAERLIHRHATTQKLRTLDALQLGIAIDLRDKGRIDSFVCADESLCAIARDEGFSIVNPSVRP